MITIAFPLSSMMNRSPTMEGLRTMEATVMPLKNRKAINISRLLLTAPAMEKMQKSTFAA